MTDGVPHRSKQAAFTVAQLAARWQCSDGHVYGLIHDGLLKAFKVGTLLRVRAEEVDRIENTTVEPIEPAKDDKASKPRARRAEFWLPPILPISRRDDG